MPSDNIPLSLYVHIPWCIQKCPYCDFNSHALKQPPDEAAYIAHLLHDLEHDIRAETRPLTSIFIGGGTPSVFAGASIAALLDGIRARMAFADNIEITLEANPGTFEQEKFRAYREAGVNRLSIGIQSFSPAQLRKLGRIHSADEAERAVKAARQAGFARINTDLMFALPGQSVADALVDLERAIALEPEHISWYQLTLEPNTAFYANPPTLPDDDTQTEIYEAGSALLRRAGYRQYETSAWTRGMPSAHNLNYWQFGDYLGIGAGAHGKLTSADGIRRISKFRAPTAYQQARGALANPYADQMHSVAPEEQPFEFMMNALRLADGVPARYLDARTALTLADVQDVLQRLAARGLLDADYRERLCTTPRGFALLNDVLAEFLP
ncbi:MAG: radical SAM family heme chaperone HemW [Cardiobacteriaceae bacterium]|nr:radical SAM family heme chaperone HemW [Cardiobacteriaceae bacterium]